MPIVTQVRQYSCDLSCRILWIEAYLKYTTIWCKLKFTLCSTPSSRGHNKTAAEHGTVTANLLPYPSCMRGIDIAMPTLHAQHRVLLTCTPKGVVDESAVQTQSAASAPLGSLLHDMPHDPHTGGAAVDPAQIVKWLTFCFCGAELGGACLTPRPTCTNATHASMRCARNPRPCIAYVNKVALKQVDWECQLVQASDQHSAFHQHDIQCVVQGGVASWLARPVMQGWRGDCTYDASSDRLKAAQIDLAGQSG